jgi:DNA-binding NarL/FixJ family response regulator
VPESPVRVVLVDDHALFRDGLRELLRDDDVLVVAEGSDGKEAVELVRAHAPDLLILDVEMPGQPAVQTIEQVRKLAPGTRIMVLTMHEEAALVHELLRCGASAYLTKAIGRSELLAAVRSIGRSRGTVMLSVRRETFEGMEREDSDGKVLSPREQEVLRLLAEGRSNAQIAKVLFVAEGTIKRHLTNIYAKLDAVSRLDAVRKATAAKLL